MAGPTGTEGAAPGGPPKGAPRRGRLSKALGAARRSLHLAPPKAEPEVTDLIHELGLSAAEVSEIWGVFKRLKKSGGKWSMAGPKSGEVRAVNIINLVRQHRHWVSKILAYLLDMAGARDTITWDAFIYCMLQFCALSKMELCQFMFFMIGMEIRTWNVHILTATQLEEFFEEYRTCPVQSFGTRSIDFARLPLSRYGMRDFIELAYRYCQLINPVLHLQRELQRSLPGMSYWLDCDVCKVRNRKLGRDFFRHKKMIMLHEAVQLATGAIAPKEDEAAREPPPVAQARPKDKDGLRPRGFVPLPLGPERPPTWRPAREAPMPEWMQAHFERNVDPLRGTALGTGAEIARAPDIPPALPRGWKAVPDPEQPKRLYYWNTETDEVTWTAPPIGPQTMNEAKDMVRETMGERLSRVKPGALSEGLVTKLQARGDKEITSAMERSLELNFVREARKRPQPKQWEEPESVWRTTKAIFRESARRLTAKTDRRMAWA